MSGILQDIGYAVRTFAQSPTHTVTVLLALTLGIGVNTAVFTIVEAVILRPLPYPEPHRLVMLWAADAKREGSRHMASPEEFSDWSTPNSVFDETAAYAGWHPTWTGQEDAEQLRGWRVSASLFGLLGAKPFVGRAFFRDEENPGRDTVLLLSYGLWQRRFGADVAVIGQRVVLNGRGFTIVGVMPRDFLFPDSPDFWAPLAFHERGSPISGRYLRVIGRLRAGVRLEQAQDVVTSLIGGQSDRRSVIVVPLHDEVVGRAGRGLLLLWAAVTVVLLIACVDAAGLLIARAAVRRHEISVRAMLGANRWRLIRQLLTESVLLSVVAGALGVVLAYWLAGALIAIIPPSTPRLHEICIDGRVLTFTLLLACSTGLGFGLAPAIGLTRKESSQSLMAASAVSAADPVPSWFRNVLLTGQISLAVALAITAGLCVLSFVRLQHVDPGFDGAHLLTMRIQLPRAAPDQRHGYFLILQEFLRGTRALPGVVGAAAITSLPMSGSDLRTPVTPDNRRESPDQADEAVAIRFITPDYFRTMGIQMLSGREFTADDTVHAFGSVIVNASLARHFWAYESPIGRHLQLFGTRAQVVGVVEDVRGRSLSTNPEPEAFIPFADDSAWPSYIVVRADSEPRNLFPRVRTVLRTLDRSIAVTDVFTMDELLIRSTSAQRSYAILFGGFAVVALALALLGIYGVTSYVVTMRTRELGIRIALGAPPSRVMMAILQHVTWLAIMGAGVGIGLAAATLRTLSSLLFELNAVQSVVFLGVPVLAVAATLLAAAVPARRAMHVDPLAAIRHE